MSQRQHPCKGHKTCHNWVAQNVAWCDDCLEDAPKNPLPKGSILDVADAPAETSARESVVDLYRRLLDE